jgi:phage terminase small subunit
MEVKLTQRLRDFIQYYDGDPIKCMRLAGFEGSNSYLKQKAEQALKDPAVQVALKQRDAYYESRTKLIADRHERQALWTHIMRNSDPDAINEYDSSGMPKKPENIPLATRLKASEMLGKSEGDFVERVSIEGNITITDIIKSSYSLDDDALDIEAIEAEYNNLKDKKTLINQLEQAPTDAPLEEDNKELPSLNEFI